MNASQTSILSEIIVDNFAGGGGASTGIELATGRVVDIAINHDPDAILMHKTNHPYTEHYQASVWDIDPREVCRGRPVGLAWFSPDCKHFSKAKGAALVDRNIRGLAWIVLRWAGLVRPRVIILENVEEFQTWGPVRNGKPVKAKSGQTFRKWKQQLLDLGYAVDHRELVAADYGAPTTRKRFVLVARCDGQPIVWPKPTHSESGKNGLKKWRSAAEIIDWSLPCYSVFASKQEIKARYGVNAVRPLAENTMRRVIRGVDKFTIKSGKPFIVDCNHSGSGHIYDAENPHGTITAKNTSGLCEPVLSPCVLQDKFNNAPQDIRRPLTTVTAVGAHELCSSLLAPVTFSNTSGCIGAPASKPVHTVTTDGKQVLASAQLMQIGQTGGGDRARSVDAPVATIVSKAEACITSAQLIQYHTEQSESVRANGVGAPMPTVDASNRYGLTTAHLVEYFSTGRPLDVREPMHTITTREREALTSVHISKYFSGVDGADVGSPLPTVTAIDHNSLCAAHIAEFKGQDKGQDAREPLRTVTAGDGQFAECRTVLVKAGTGDYGHWPEIRALLNRHCGYTLADDEILLLCIGGVYYYIHDILLRMLTPRELYAAMGFPPDYIIDHDYKGNEYGRGKQVARCGNAVCPPMAEAVVRANYAACDIKLTTMMALERMVAV